MVPFFTLPRSSPHLSELDNPPPHPLHTFIVREVLVHDVHCCLWRECVPKAVAGEDQEVFVAHDIKRFDVALRAHEGLVLFVAWGGGDVRSNRWFC